MAKNSQVLSASGTRRRQRLTLGDIQQWYRDCRSELRKVTWPTPEQTRNLTLVVIAVCTLMGFFLFIVDTVLASLVKLIIGS